MVELDAVSFFEFFAVDGFEFGLGAGEVGSGWVVDEAEVECGVDAVAEVVEGLEHVDAVLVDAWSSLFVDVFLEVAGEAGDEGDAVVFEELGEAGGVGEGEGGEVGADDDGVALVGECGDEVFEVGVEFWCAAGDVDGGDGCGGEEREDGVHGRFGHGFLSVWAGLVVAVAAGLVAAWAEVDLEGVEGAAGEWFVEEGCDGLAEGGLERWGCAVLWCSCGVHGMERTFLFT